MLWNVYHNPTLYTNAISTYIAPPSVAHGLPFGLHSLRSCAGASLLCQGQGCLLCSWAAHSAAPTCSALLTGTCLLPCNQTLHALPGTPSIESHLLVRCLLQQHNGTNSELCLALTLPLQSRACHWLLVRRIVVLHFLHMSSLAVQFAGSILLKLSTYSKHAVLQGLHTGIQNKDMCRLVNTGAPDMCTATLHEHE